MNNLSNKEFCPECGNHVGMLLHETGWCRKCTAEYDANSTVCRVCRRPKVGEVCDYCKIEAWLKVNANHIEHYMLRGVSFSVAVEKLRIDVQPTCAVCGEVILRARRDAVFCSRYPKCKQASRRYIYLYQTKKLSKAEALSTALDEIGGHSESSSTNEQTENAA